MELPPGDDPDVHPTQPSDIGLLTSKRAQSIMCGGISAPRANRNAPKYMTALMNIMKEWPEWALRNVLSDDTQPAAARGIAAQVILMMKGEMSSLELILDRTEGKLSSQDVSIINQQALMLGLNAVGPGTVAPKTAVTPSQLQAAFAAIQAKKEAR